MNYDIKTLIENDGFVCPACGKRHFGGLSDCVIGKGAIKKVPEYIRKFGGSKAFVLCDTKTYNAAGKAVADALDEASISYSMHIIKREHPSPDERIVGEAMMFCPADCDIIIAVGGGVINDTCKILAAARKVPDFIVGTAPSMDGFASGTSSMEREGLKVSLPSKCPDVVFGEPSVIANAPVQMIRSGIGDMLAKYVSIVEWRIASLLLGEYYCPVVADIVGTALKNCVDSAEGAVNGDEESACAVMEGLVISGLAMNYAGLSRPASGMEHYISHILDMRSLEFGTNADFHGIQCGISSLMTIRAYEKLKKEIPDKERALQYAGAFDLEKWNDFLRGLLGHGAEAMIAGERREGKYNLEKHSKRLDLIIEHFDEITDIISSLPKSDELESFMKRIGHPVSFGEIGISEKDARDAFAAAKDIRDKYVLGRLLWDLGLIDKYKTEVIV